MRTPKHPTPDTAGALAPDTARLSPRELFAYYHRTAPVGDVAFLLHHGANIDPALECDVRDLYERARRGAMSRAAIYREYVNLQDRWRRLAAARDRAERARELDADRARELAAELDSLDALLETPAAERIAS